MFLKLGNIKYVKKILLLSRYTTFVGIKGIEDIYNENLIKEQIFSPHIKECLIEGAKKWVKINRLNQIEYMEFRI